jgi:transketolase
VAAWRIAMTRTDGPTALVLSRQDLPALSAEGAPGAERGAYVLRDAPAPKAILLATGSEVSLAVQAHDRLAAAGVATRVVSMPCWELFAAQSAEYIDSVLPPSISARVSIEAGVTFGWREWVGNRGISIGVDRYGASAPGEVLLEKFGITCAAVEAAVRKLL